mmetsp:Transcript_37846/g.106923  ORF Transcript_37846/g.106923 Transcript_37846/m.106923 type:complete len:198 (-) Transcript_37846:809-1402(-)
MTADNMYPDPPSKAESHAGHFGDGQKGAPALDQPSAPVVAVGLPVERILTPPQHSDVVPVVHGSGGDPAEVGGRRGTAAPSNNCSGNGLVSPLKTVVTTTTTTTTTTRMYLKSSCSTGTSEPLLISSHGKAFEPWGCLGDGDGARWICDMLWILLGGGIIMGVLWGVCALLACLTICCIPGGVELAKVRSCLPGPRG